MVQVAYINWQKWINYFEHNAATLMTIDWDGPDALTDEEIRRIKKSTQQFQLGESSEGHHVVSQAKRYIATSGDHDYLLALQLFIQEEHRHSGYLARFLNKHGFSLVQKHPVDSAFRLLRHTFNLELSVMATLTAEIIAVPYYKALHNATSSPVLRQICRQVLRDEMQHLQFQSDTLKTLRYSRLSFNNVLKKHIVHRVLLAGTICIVWQQHHDVLNGGGFTFAKFWRTNWLLFNRLFAKQDAQYIEGTQRR